MTIVCNQSLKPFYNSVFADIVQSDVSKIRCDELFKRYGFRFENRYELFRDFLLYLEDAKKIHIIRTDFDENLFIGIEVL